MDVKLAALVDAHPFADRDRIAIASDLRAGGIDFLL
jgi:hypothetical protein